MRPRAGGEERLGLTKLLESVFGRAEFTQHIPLGQIGCLPLPDQISALTKRCFAFGTVPGDLVPNTLREENPTAGWKILASLFEKTTRFIHALGKGQLQRQIGDVVLIPRLELDGAAELLESPSGISGTACDASHQIV